MIWLGRGKKLSGIGLALAPALYLLGCTAVETEEPQVAAAPVVYRCEGDTQMTVLKNADTVHVDSPRGLALDLPASPPAQESRFGAPPYALVVEGDEALWMVTGQEPIACAR